MPFMMPHSNEGYHCRKALAYILISVTNKEKRKKVEKNKIKHVNGSEWGFQDTIKISHGQLVYSIRLSCQT